MTPKTSDGSQTIKRVAAQRPNRDDVEVGRHRQLAQEGARSAARRWSRIEISGERRMKLNRPRAKVARETTPLTISIVGMRPRTMRSWLDMS